MSGDVTYQALERLTNMPNRSGNQGDRIAGQLYYDVEFTGGSISGVTLTDVTINGTITTRTERVITASGPVTVASDDYVITIDKTVPTATTVTLPSVPTTSRSLIIKDGQGQAGANNITISGNGNTIDGSATYVINVSWGAAELIYNGTEWNIISSYATNGNVVGAAFSTDNAISRFDGTTGRNIQNSTVTIGDTGIFAGASIDTASAVNVLKINGTSLTDVTGTGTVVLSTSPTLTTPNIGSATGSVTGNAGTASKLQTAHLIGNVSFDGSADITPQQLSLASEASDTTCFPLFINTASSAAQQPKYNTSLTYNASTNALATGLLTSNTLNLNASTNQILFDADGTNVGTMTMAALTAARTWTLPNVSGTLLTTSGAATVSAKTFDNTNTAVFKDNGFSLEDDVDATKTLQWQLSGITTAATRTWTVQDVSGTVYVTGGQQVSVADGGTGRGTATAYAVLCGGTTATGAHQSIASVGTSGQVLTSNGPAALPTFQAVASSAWSFVFQITASNQASVDFGTASTGGNFLSGYDYFVDFTSVIPINNGDALYARVGTGATPTYQTAANYLFNTIYNNNTSINIGNTTAGTAATSFLFLNPTGISNVSTNYGADGGVLIHNPSSSNYKKIEETAVGLSNSLNASAEINFGWWQQTTAVTGFRFFCSSGNISSGVFTLYNRKRS